MTQAPANPQTLNRYSYALNNPVLHTDPSGHCIPGIGDCRYTGQINWADGAAYATGVGQGVLNVVTSVVMAPVAVAEAIANPNAAIAGVQQQFATVAAGADVLVNDPAQAAAIINDNPNAIGQIMGEVLATAAMAKIGGEGGGKPGGCSFAADTPVLTDAGLVAIGALHVGDTVLAYNEQTNTTESYPVTRVWVNLDPVVEYLTIAGETLETTPEHPFFVLLRGWVAAGDLVEGDQVRRVDGSFGTVEAIAFEQRSAVLYNLTVDVAHTYFVGSEGWLVHNSGTCNVRANQAAGDAFRDKVAADFEAAGFQVQKEVTKSTPFGARRIDIEVRDADGNVLGGIETKAGNARYRAPQRAKDAWLARFEDYVVTVVRDR